MLTSSTRPYLPRPCPLSGMRDCSFARIKCLCAIGWNNNGSDAQARGRLSGEEHTVKSWAQGTDVGAVFTTRCHPSPAPSSTYALYAFILDIPGSVELTCITIHDQREYMDTKRGGVLPIKPPGANPN